MGVVMRRDGSTNEVYERRGQTLQGRQMPKLHLNGRPMVCISSELEQHGTPKAALTWVVLCSTHSATLAGRPEVCIKWSEPWAQATGTSPYPTQHLSCRAQPVFSCHLKIILRLVVCPLNPSMYSQSNDAGTLHAVCHCLCMRGVSEEHDTAADGRQGSWCWAPFLMGKRTSKSSATYIF